MPEFDYIIVGAGSAGCVLAHRLSADPRTRVAIVEAGPRDLKLEIKMPAAFTKLFHTKFDWDLFTTSQPELKARELYWPRGRTLGGSSSINAQMWVRGARADYDRWAESAPGWSYADVLPYFHRAENRVGSNNGDVYGIGGPLWIEELRDPNPLRASFFEACAEAGHTRLGELNEPEIDGYAPTPVTQHRGRRWSAADGYLRAALKRDNVTLFVNTLTEKLVLHGDRVTGVQIRPAKGSPQTLTAAQEVLVSAGAIHSPHLLQLSGIGDPETLRAAGVSPTVTSEGVGRGLQDHLSSPAVMFTRDAATLVDAEKPINLVKFLLQRTGMLTSNVGEGVLFGRSDPSLEQPDLEFIFAPVPFIHHGATEPEGHGITIGVVLLQPESKGSITLRSADPSVAPVIEAGYLTESRDLDRLVSGVAQAQALFATTALRNSVADPMLPTAEQTDLVEHVRSSAETLYHPTGTCRMGSDDGAVVDEQLRVRGVEGLRVVDASVMPHIIRGHTHAPTVMIAEKAADLIRG
ncbi:MAG: GMC family oxidoreductase N-terminal domain-containing protein [Actinomycetota bacterium]|nr:GMC family oxidoreductase N-terminal domain-containing protein [Actinomycetota bacterium]